MTDSNPDSSTDSGTDSGAPSADDVTVADNPEKSRFEATLPEGTVAGFAAYERHDDLIAFTHTEVEKKYGGRGIATTIITTSLDEARAKGLTVRPICPLYVTFFDEHPEYADLLGR